MKIKKLLKKMAFNYDNHNNPICDIGAIEIYYDSGIISKTVKKEEFVLVPLFISDLMEGNFDNKEWINQKIVYYNIFISTDHTITLSIRMGL